jgi:O-antigen biosynthesis protein
MSKVGVVIPVFGRLDLLQECCKRLPLGVPVYIVDDCTPDPVERKQIKEFARDKGYRFFQNDENLGFPATVNKGVEKSREPLILLLNSDVLLEQGAMDVLVTEFEDPGIGVAGPMLLFPEGSQYGPSGKVQHIGVVFGVLGQPKHLFIGWDPTNPRVSHRRDQLQAITGACFMTRRELWKRIGGFATVYGKGTFEDIEYCVVARLLKYRVVCNPSAIGYHYVSQSAKNSGGYPIAQNQRIFTARVGGALKNDDYLYL